MDVSTNSDTGGHVDVSTNSDTGGHVDVSTNSDTGDMWMLVLPVTHEDTWKLHQLGSDWHPRLCPLNIVSIPLYSNNNRKHYILSHPGCYK